MCEGSSEGRHDLRDFTCLCHFTFPHVLIRLCYSRQTKGITLKIAGNNHLVPVQRVTDDDLQVLASVLGKAVFITGKLFQLHLSLLN